MLGVLFSSFGVIETDWRPIIYGMAVLSLVLGAFVALRQRDVKRMLAYSSINHAGFILLGVSAGTARGASVSLYYLFAYMLMTIGSFAIVTVLGGEGDGDHDISRYRGLAGRQPVIALALAVLLLAQAGAPFTTGLWAKLQVVFAAVGAGEGPGRHRHGDRGGGGLLLPAGRRRDVRRWWAGRVRGRERRFGGTWRRGRYDRRRHHRGGGPGQRHGGGLAWATPAAAARSMTTINEQILLDDEATGATATTGDVSKRTRRPSGSRFRRSPAWPSACARG